MDKSPDNKQKIVVPQLIIEEAKHAGLGSASTPSSPTALRKVSSVRYNCLCSPTTHAGSFRCRYHRNSSLTRNSMSVGSKLSELTSVSTKLSEIESKPARICDQLHAH